MKLNKSLFWILLILELLFIAVTTYISMTPSGDDRGGLAFVAGIFFYIPCIIAYIIILFWYLVHTLVRKQILAPDNIRDFKIFWFQFFILLIVAWLTIR
ncbi:MAG: hypothetical protein KW788_05275 [Candidatus Doudnabacteria bacterium]|nr:hypothetical protein [Candidatus Doudnabacteria bacterium]